ncbi:MAG TPA: FAD-dependent oxidoreductase [Micromonosporaceae bacterium]|jgi:NADPH-dependent 2,4-dienoyl-CoA reductase/sulfur reductase-like enzyme
MGDDRTFVIVGASLAGAKAAEALRNEGFGGRVVLVGAETHPPYERPPLSKGYLLGNEEVANAYVHEIGWYADHDVELILGATATEVNRADRMVSLDIGGTLHYDKLLLTTGSRVRELDLPGRELDGVAYLRTMGESTHLRERLREGTQVLIVGAGWIGLEVAAAARQHGASVRVVEVDSLPLRRVLGDEVAAIYRDLHQAHGVTFHFEAGVRELGGSAGKVTDAVLSDGTEVPADLVLIGVGVAPNVELAKAAGLEVERGIIVDEYLRTSDPDIYAAGDVAEFWSPLLRQRIRVEHWANALNGGPAAAASMLGQNKPYDWVPYFYSDQYTSSPLIGMEYGGFVAPGGYDRVVFRGSPAISADADPEFIVFWTQQGRVLAGMNANIWDVQDDQIQPLVRAGHAGATVDLARLADPSVPLTDLLEHREYA